MEEQLHICENYQIQIKLGLNLLNLQFFFLLNFYSSGLLCKFDYYVNFVQHAIGKDNLEKEAKVDYNGYTPGSQQSCMFDILFIIEIYI